MDFVNLVSLCSLRLAMIKKQIMSQLQGTSGFQAMKIPDLVVNQIAEKKKKKKRRLGLGHAPFLGDFSNYENHQGHDEEGYQRNQEVPNRIYLAAHSDRQCS